MNVVWHGNYVRYFEQARCALLDRIDYNYLQMKESGYVWPVVELRIKFVRPAIFKQEIVATATLAEYENRIKIKYLITDHDSGEKLTEGFSVQVAVDGQSGEMCFESPQILFDKVAQALCDSA